MAGNQAEIELLAKEEVTKALSKIEKQVGGLKKTVDSGIDEGVGKSFLNLGRVAETALGFGVADAAIKATQAIKGFVTNSVRSAMLLEQQFQSLEIQTRGTAEALLTDLRSATKGLVDDLSLALSANRALALGLQKADLPALFEVAAARARIMGISVTQATNDIVTGIGRASPLILDNLGIVFDTEQVMNDYAESIGKTAQALSKLESAQALTNAAIKSGATDVASMNLSIETTAVSVERGRVGWASLGLEIGSFLNRALGNAIFAFKSFDEQLLSTNPTLQSSALQMEDLNQKLADTEAQAKGLSDSIKGLRADLAGITAVKTDEEVAAEHAVVEAKKKRIALERQLRDFEAGRITAQVTGVADDPEALNKAIAEQNKFIDDQNLIIEQQSIGRQSLLNKALEQAEADGKLKKESAGTLSDIQEALDTRLKTNDAEVETLSHVNEQAKIYEETIKNVEKSMGEITAYLREQVELLRGEGGEELTSFDLKLRAIVESIF